MAFGVGLFVAGGAVVSEAGGFFNMPSSLPQCFGCGFGAGYHAPMNVAFPTPNHQAAKPIQYTMHPVRGKGCAAGFCGGMATLTPEAPVTYAPPQQVWQEAPFTPAPTMNWLPVGQPTSAPVTSPPTPAEQREPASPSDTPAPEQLPLPRN